MKTQADICFERFGFGNPPAITVKCPCADCVGNLRFDATNFVGSHAFLLCGECRCTHCLGTTKDPAESAKELEALKAGRTSSEG